MHDNREDLLVVMQVLLLHLYRIGLIMIQRGNIALQMLVPSLMKGYMTNHLLMTSLHTMSQSMIAMMSFKLFSFSFKLATRKL